MQKAKVAYKRQSELLEETNMSGMQQMLMQQQQKEKAKAKANEAKEP